ncbi:MAG: alpha/beta hydrolase [Myxococcota bacterium]
MDLSRRELLGALGLGLSLAGCRSFRNLRPYDASVRRTSGLYYLEDNHPRHQLDVFQPMQPGPHPVVVFVHGGFWRAQDRNYLPIMTGLYANVGASLAARGVLCFVTSYRLHPDASAEGMLSDVAAAIRFAQAKAHSLGGDPERVFLAGHSAGAHLVSFLGAEPNYLAEQGVKANIRGVVALSGLYDLVALADRLEPELRDTVLLPLFGPDPGRLRRYSPLTYLPNAKVPFCFLVGERDLLACREDFWAAQAVFRGHPERAEFHLLQGRTHAEVVLEIGGPQDGVAPVARSFLRRQGGGEVISR